MSRKFRLRVRASFTPPKEVASRSAALDRALAGGSSPIFTNERAFESEVGDILAQLAAASSLSEDDWVSQGADRGAEALLTYHWRCVDSSALSLEGCDVHAKLSTLSTSYGSFFQASGALSPVGDTDSAMQNTATTRRRSFLKGLVVHMHGEGGLEIVSAVSVLNIVAQVMAMLLIGSHIAACMGLTCFKGHQRRMRAATESYSEEVHAKLSQIVSMKKAEQPSLAKIRDAHLHAKLLDDVEVLCGFAVDHRTKSDKVSRVLEALAKHAGSVPKAAKELGEDGQIRLSLLEGASGTSATLS